jgi:hypothetical protein
LKTINPHLSPKRILLYVFGLLVLIFCIARAMKGSDFEVYLAASETILKSGDIYDATNTLNVQYFYSPLFALVLAPFTYLPAFIVKLAWLLFSVWCIYRIWQLVQSYLNVTFLSKAQQVAWVVIAHGILAGFIIDNFHMVQVTFFILWATLESIRLIWQGKTVKGAFLLGLAINFKVLPLLFIPYLFYRNKWQAGLLCIAVVVLLIIAPWFFLDNDHHSFLLHQWWATINPLNASHSLELDKMTFDLPALVAACFTTADGELKTSFATFQYTLTAVRLFFILLTLAFLRTLPFREAPSSMYQLREIAFLLMATVLLFPHQNKYANVYLLPAFAYIIYYLMAAYNADKHIFRTKIRYQAAIALLVLGALCLTMTGSSVVGETFYNLLSRYKSITIGTILLVPVLLLLSPATMVKKGSPANQ